MSAAPVRDNLLPNIIIPEDSILRKAATCIPAIGFVIGFFAERSIANRISVERNGLCQDLQNSVYVIKVKNDYKKASVARSLISGAGLITVVALGILTGPVGYACLGVGGICILASLVYAKKIHTNTQTIASINQHYRWGPVV
jgi:hypothetical protein